MLQLLMVATVNIPEYRLFGCKKSFQCDVEYSSNKMHAIVFLNYTMNAFYISSYYI